MKVYTLYNKVPANESGTVQNMPLDKDKDESGLVQAVYSGGAAGTIKLEGTLDGTNYVEVASFTANGAKSVLLFPNMRATVSGSNGTGTLSLYLGD